jgi:hypothetical protein
MAFINACIADSSAPYRDVKRVQFGILNPDEIVGQNIKSLYFPHSIQKKFNKIFLLNKKNKKTI